jgi:hypothetical protein
MEDLYNQKKPSVSEKLLFYSSCDYHYAATKATNIRAFLILNFLLVNSQYYVPI